MLFRFNISGGHKGKVNMLETAYSNIVDKAVSAMMDKENERDRKQDEKFETFRQNFLHIREETFHSQKEHCSKIEDFLKQLKGYQL
ncbi:hypothetical protein JTE90_024737 [Oedothorax gibbosus]|uniref:Uncharacterized protein n=1 Tax=Oedothorax gibbosus TaxID=931172 RepID=A0AAV6U9U7_9ARAC|nr:hypothetical protein JTE90_024737 [Oedothorax gibbosus]